MIDAAKKSNFHIIGISDHVALPIKATSHRMEYEERIKYLNDLKRVKNINHDNIKIFAGFEAEYQEEYLNIYIDWLKKKEIDYLILGQHFEDVNDPKTYFGGRIGNDGIIKYVDICISAMKTGLFLFVAHPDLFMTQVAEFNQVCYEQSIRLIKSSIELDVYLEYNAGGIRHSTFYGLEQEDYFYPRYEFWQLVKELDAKVIVNADAHKPNELNDYAYQLACKQIIEYDLNLVKDIDFVKYQTRAQKFIKENNF